MKTFKKRRRKIIYSQLLQKSLFFDFSRGQFIIFLQKTRKSILFYCQSFLKTIAQISHKLNLGWYSDTNMSPFRSKPIKNSCEFHQKKGPDRDSENAPVRAGFNFRISSCFFYHLVNPYLHDLFASVQGVAFFFHMTSSGYGPDWRVQ